MKLEKSGMMRLVFSAVIAAAFQLCFCMLPSLRLQMVSGIIILLLYFIPMIYNLMFIKTHYVTGIKPIIKKDLMLQTIPSVIITVFIECIIILFGAQPLPGLSSMIFCAAALIITAIFWLMYFIYNNYYKPR